MSSYPSSGFKVWKSEKAWLWFLDDPRHGGMIGAASSQIEAVREACSAIQDLSTRDPMEALLPCAARALSRRAFKKLVDGQRTVSSARCL